MGSPVRFPGEQVFGFVQAGEDDLNWILQITGRTEEKKVRIELRPIKKAVKPIKALKIR